MLCLFCPRYNGTLPLTEYVMLNHIMTGCKIALAQGRYTWRLEMSLEEGEKRRILQLSGESNGEEFITITEKDYRRDGGEISQLR